MQLGRATRGIVVALVAGLPAGTALAVASAGPATPRATAPATVRIVSASQRVLLRDRSVLVRVSVPSARWVRLAVIGSPVRSVRFARPGTRLVRLSLGAAARRALSSCARRSLAVRAASSGRRTAVGRRVVVVDLPACRPVAGGGASGQPSGGAGGSQAGGSGSGGGGESGGGGPGQGTPGPTRSATVAGGEDRKCDFLDPSVCLQPWPNDWFTRADASAATGRRLNLDPLAMPRNRFGKPIDATEQNRLDGF
ncbi:MAG: hypothetical protein QOC78_3372, partial [Solirubrobacteraceae bacterium]|nr:hypothetical protein [Solirubrobacteraceae bacterium]